MPISDQEFLTDQKSPHKKSYRIVMPLKPLQKHFKWQFNVVTIIPN